MGLIYALAAIVGVLSVIVVILENKGILTTKYILKTVASMGFVMLSLLAIIKGGYDSWKVLVIAALVLGMLGDIFLSSENVVPDKKAVGQLNITGGIFFAFGHIIYVVWLLKFVEGFNLYTLFALFGMPLLMFILSVTKVMKPGKLLIPVLFYALFLGCMLMGAVNSYVYLKGEEIAPLILAGGILFCISDSTLAYYNFGHKDQTAVKYIYMPTYYVAQILFALTLLY